MSISRAMQAYKKTSELYLKFSNGEITKKEFDQSIKEADTASKRLSAELKVIQKKIKDSKSPHKSLP